MHCNLDDIKLEIRNKFPSMNVIENGLADLIVDHLNDQGLLTAWQPIETAPKDGTPVLLICDEVERDVGNPYKPLFPVSAYFDQEKWYINDTVYYSAEAVNPTAWTPLQEVGE